MESGWARFAEQNYRATEPVRNVKDPTVMLTWRPRGRKTQPLRSCPFLPFARAIVNGPSEKGCVDATLTAAKPAPWIAGTKCPERPAPKPSGKPLARSVQDTRLGAHWEDRLVRARSPIQHFAAAQPTAVSSAEGGVVVPAPARVGAVPSVGACASLRREFAGEPDAGNPHLRFDEGLPAPNRASLPPLPPLCVQGAVICVK